MTAADDLSRERIKELNEKASQMLLFFHLGSPAPARVGQECSMDRLCYVFAVRAFLICFSNAMALSAPRRA